jgi:phosphoribosylamine--glycine ligase
MAICDGQRAVALAPAQDFKRAGEGDTGPNTGGMGSYSPVPIVDQAMIEHIMDVAVRPTLAALRDRGIDYRGVLYAGLMLTASGPKVIEFNVRFGDPETQVVTGRWEGDVTALLMAAAAGQLDEVAPPAFSEESAVTLVLAAEGYPAEPKYGDRIRGLKAAAKVPGVAVHPAGVKLDEKGHFLTSGGRVVNVRALAPTIAAARDRAYEAAAEITWDGRWYRGDIAAAAAALQLHAEESA